MRRRRILWFLSSLVAAVVVLTAALWPVYVDPRTDQPGKADAILVLGGAHDGREQLALRLAHEGYAPRVFFSDPYENSPLINRICHGGYSFEVICFDPSPRTTRGEGRELAALARAENWRRVIVITFTPTSREPATSSKSAGTETSSSWTPAPAYRSPAGPITTSTNPPAISKPSSNPADSSEFTRLSASGT